MTRLHLVSVSSIALLTACSAAGGAQESPDDVASVAQHLDNVCTPDPTKSIADDPWWGNRWASSFTPNGYDLHHLDVVGPHCESGPGTPGYDSRCCEANKGTADYNACKTEQETAAKTFLASFSVKTPLLPPYRAYNVGVWQGYYYDDNTSHTGAIDFGKTSMLPSEDPSFDVYAVANGTVVYSNWLSGSAGNSVLVKHEVAGGGWYLSEYRHLRGGRSRDKKLACACIDPSKSTAADRLAGCTATQKATAICKYAANPSYDALWGTESDSLPALGAVVSRGQRIAASGNTGAVVGVLDANGNPPANGNTHLHHSFWAPRPGGVDDGQPGIDVIAIDPLGVYSKNGGTIGGKHCYDPGAPVPFSPALAPFPPDFSGALSASVLQEALYYPNAGWGPQTLSFYDTASGVLGAGGYNPAAQSSNWKLWLEIDKTTMNSKLAGYTTRKLRQMSVRMSGSSPRYTGIWEGLEAGELAETHLDISNTEFDTLWHDNIANGPYRMTDHVMFVVNGTPHHNVSLSNKSGGFYFYWGQTAAQLQSLDSSLQASGWKPYAISAAVGATGSGVTYSAVWRQLPGTYQLQTDISPDVFDSVLAVKKALGYRLHRVQGYDNGTRMLAIWMKPTAPTCGTTGCERTGVCAAGQFKSVPVCSSTNLCPNGTAPISGMCSVPTDASGHVNCINTNPNNCPPGTPAGTDCRVYNWEMRQSTGTMCKDAQSFDICGARATTLCDAY
ncbi:MAG: M23 family metallopeptidase [Polyangiales bacterium]